MSPAPIRAAVALLAAIACALVAPAGITPAAAGEPGPSPVTAIAAGSESTCALRADGTVWCWGAEGSGWLGNGTADGSSTPVQVSGITDAKLIGNGAMQSCAVRADNTVLCWGPAVVKDWGIMQSTLPFPLITFTAEQGVTALGVGVESSCYLQDAWWGCWGRPDEWGLVIDALAIPDVVDMPLPHGDLPPLLALAMGEAHACAVSDDGRVWCKGDNSSLQLGAEDGNQWSTAPVPGVSDAVGVAAGREHSCALLADGTVACWGGNSAGQLGDGTIAGRAEPAPVEGLTGVVEIAAGGRTTCALRSNGNVRCWGANASGQLGSGSPHWSLLPVRVQGISTATHISVGARHACATLEDGSARCWGANGGGQLGDGTATNRLAPVPVLGFPPTTGAPVVRLRSGATLTASGVPATAAWESGDGSGLGIASYEVADSLDGAATWSQPRTVAGPSTAVALPRTGSLRFRARAVDHMATAGAWGSGPDVRVRIAQQAAARLRGSWAAVSNEALDGGSARWTRAAGASATWRTTARSVGIVMTTGPSMGRVAVYVDGTRVATVDTHRAVRKVRQVVWTRTWPVSGEHTIRLVALGTPGHSRVELDALVALP